MKETQLAAELLEAPEPSNPDSAAAMLPKTAAQGRKGTHSFKPPSFRGSAGPTETAYPDSHIDRNR